MVSLLVQKLVMEQARVIDSVTVIQQVIDVHCSIYTEEDSNHLSREVLQKGHLNHVKYLVARWSASTTIGSD